MAYVLLDGAELSAALDRHGLTVDQVARRVAVDVQLGFDPVDVAEVLVRATEDETAIVSADLLRAIVTHGLRPSYGLAERLVAAEL